jgi:hypothetical protein
MRLNRIVVLTLMTALMTITSTRQSTAQTAPLPLGQVTVTFQMSSCPASFYQGSGTNPNVCYGANVSCPSANPIGLTFSYINGNAPNAPIGTIVLFNSGGGEMTMTDNNDLTASDYATAKYAVVQTSWATDWEDTDDGLSMTAPPPAPSILNAACRPATFLNFIANNSQYRASNTAMCAQGASAGSGAVAYSIVWYGLGATLNDVELLSGPVFSNIQIGCQVGNSPATCAVICQSGACNTTSLCGPTQTCLVGSAAQCSQGTKNEIASVTGPWTDAPQYLPGYASAVQGWTGNMGPGTCNNVGGSGAATTQTENTAWLQQSIVNGGAGAFSWPMSLVGLGGWACYSYQNTTPPTCFTSATECPNNSGPEGEQFYIAVNNSGGTLPTQYVLTGIQDCKGAEGVEDQYSVDPDFPTESGQQGIENHMEQNCKVPQ